MLRNYVRIALRSLRKQLGYSIINVGGLGIGLACAFLIVLHVQHERSFDRFHENGDRIFRLVSHTVAGEYAGSKSAIFPAGHAPILVERYPEIEEVILFDDRNPFLRVGQQSRRIGTVGFMSPEGLRSFSFPLLRGDAETAFENPYSILLTPGAAQTLFGSSDPVGQVVRYEDDFDVTVTGIIADVPSNSHLEFEALAPIELMRELMGADAMENFSNSNYYLYFRLAPNADPAVVSDKLDDYILERVDGDVERARMSKFVLQPITDIHFTTDIDWDVGSNVNPRVVYLLSGIAALILLIAGINFMNLSTARAVKRAREVGVRKSVGADRGQLVRQFLGESVFLSLIAIVLALALAWLFLPVYRGIVGTDVGASAAGLSTVLGLVGIGILAGLLAGIYPAVYLSAFKPARVLKGEVTRGSSAAVLRRGLIVVQFGISVFLIVCTLTVYNQLDYMRSRQLGFEKEQVIFAPIAQPIRDQYDSYRETVLQNPRIVGVAQAGNVPGRVGTSRGYNWPGPAGQDENGRSFYTVLADYDYIETLGLGLIAGRDFSRDMPTDFENTYIVNETAAREIGFANPEDAVGAPFRAWDREMGEIIGVVRDFHFQSLHQAIGPVVINIKPWISYVAFRVAPGDYAGAVDFLTDRWADFSPGFPFEFRFLDEDLDRLYRAEAELGKLFTFFAVIAIFVACLGLFGLAAYSTEQRTKEIGIRKVLGASTQSITVLLSGEFTKLVVVAFAVAAPIAFFVMRNWLADFAYRATMAWWIFALAGLMAFAIAWLTVSYQSVRAARLNPVESLRYE